MRPEDIDLNSDKPLYVFSEKESVERIDTLHDLILQHLGKNWKVIVVLLVIFTALLLVLLTFGVTIDAEHKHHLQAFLIVFIISLSFWLFYILVMPSKDKTVMTGIVPYPKDSPYVPVDNTLCGTSIVNCTKEDVCDTKCSKNNESNYVCTMIGNNKDQVDKEVIYLGSKLKSGQSYCLPKMGIQTLNECGTYTGKAVWSGNQRWECQCLYPDFFGGNYCLDQMGCQSANKFSKLVSKDGKTWDPTVPGDPNINILTGHSPYDVDKDGKPVYSCAADNTNCIVYAEDPFTCHSNLCEEGSVSSSPGVKFDVANMNCECNDKTIKSNISGYCYPYPNITLCNPHQTTKLCTFGLNLSTDAKGHTVAYLLKTKGKTYITFTKTDKGTSYTVLVDVTVVDGVPTPFDIDSTIIKDAFYAYPIVSFSDLSAGDQANVKSILANPATGNTKLKTDKDSFNTLFEDANKFNGGYVGFPTLCSSFYQKRDDSYPQCRDILSTIGVDYNTVCDKTGSPNPPDWECGLDEDKKPVGNCSIDVTQIDGIKGMVCTNCMNTNKLYRDPYNCPDECKKSPQDVPCDCTPAGGKTCVKCENSTNSMGWSCCTTIDGNVPTTAQVCNYHGGCPADCKTCNYSTSEQITECKDPSTCKIGKKDSSDTSPFVCCKDTIKYEGTHYCTEMPSGSQCKSGDMCASGHCSGRAFLLQDGTCD